MITKQQAMTTAAIHVVVGGKCKRWRRNGATQTWKRSPERFRLPVKFGLYQYDQVTEHSTWAYPVHCEEDCENK